MIERIKMMRPSVGKGSVRTKAFAVFERRHWLLVPGNGPKHVFLGSNLMFADGLPNA